MWHSACALRQVLLQQGHLLTAIIATNTPTTPIEMTSVVVDAVDPVPLTEVNHSAAVALTAATLKEVAPAPSVGETAPVP